MPYKPDVTHPNDFEPGDWNFVHIIREPYEYRVTQEPRDVTHMVFRDPDGSYGEIAIAPTVQANGASWKWNHSLVLLTLTPSINSASGWHGWLKDGYWTSV